MNEAGRVGSGEDDARGRAPLGQRLLVIALIAVPMVAALLFLLLALATGKAMVLAIGWVILQLVGYSIIIPRHGLFPISPMLAAQIAIHWLGAAFILYFLFGLN